MHVQKVLLCALVVLLRAIKLKLNGFVFLFSL
jgi:hypothetical protein